MQEPGMGPGLDATAERDVTPWVALAFTAIGWTPVAWWQAALGVSHFGPLAFPAILAMVGALFGVIAVLRSIDTGDKHVRKLALLALSIALVRLFLHPLLA